jgi:hypothetical protein
VVGVTHTRTGKDWYYLEFNVNEECITGVIVCTKRNSCVPISKLVEIGQRDCG